MLTRTSRPRTPHRAVVVPLALACLVSTAILGIRPPSAPAAQVGVTTRFEIDGDKAGAYDWDNLATATPGTGSYAPYVLASGFSTGIDYYKRDLDDGSLTGYPSHPACGSALDEIGGSGMAQADGPIWKTTTGNGKPDISAIMTASERVTVPTSNGGSTVQDILYVAYESCDVINGSYNVNLTLDDGDGLAPISPTGGPVDPDGGDMLFVFQFQAGQPGVYKLFQYYVAASPGPAGCVAWCEITASVQPGAIDAIGGLANGLSFAEAAINLQLLGLAQSTDCTKVAIGKQSASLAGFSLSSALKDVVGVSPLVISDCGGVRVTKQAEAAVSGPSTPFDFTISQVDGADVHAADLDPADTDGSTATITGSLAVGDSQIWRNVITSNDYRVAETSNVPGWREQSIVCDYVDVFTADPTTGAVPWWRTGVVISSAGVATGSSFAVPPSTYSGRSISTWVPASAGLPDGIGADCRIINQSRTLTIVKAGTPSTQTFEFTATGVGADPATVSLATVDDPATTAVVENTAHLPLTSPDGTLVTVSESAVPGWTLQDITCELFQVVDGTLTSTPIVSGQGGVTIDVATGTVSGLDIAWGTRAQCTFQNTQVPGKVTVIKQVTGPGSLAGTEFAFSTTPAWDPPIGSLVVQSAGAELSAQTTREVVPGTYTLTEAATTGYLVQTLSCVAGPEGWAGSATWTRPDTNSAQVSVASGEHAVCTFSNQPQAGTLAITGTSVGGVGDFAVTATPDPGAAQTLTLTTTTPGTPSTTEPVALAAGTSYTLATPALTDWVVGTFTCNSDQRGNGFVTGSSPQVTAQPGEQITCTITYTKRARVIVTKSAVAMGTPPRFGFTFGPDPANPSTSFDLGNAEVWDSGPIDPNIAVTLTEAATASWAVIKFDCMVASGTSPALTLPSFTSVSQTFTPQPGETVTCDVRNAEHGTVAITKVANPESVTIDPDGGYSISYDLKVTSLSAMDEIYDLADQPDFAPGATIASVTWTGPDNSTPVTLAQDGYVVRNAVIGPETSHLYRVTITFTMAPDAPQSQSQCTGPGSGTYNSATLTEQTLTPLIDTDITCVAIPTPDISVTKTATGAPTIVSSDPATGTVTFQARYQIAVTNQGGSTGVYTLNEDPVLAAGATVTSVAATSPDAVVNPDFSTSDLTVASQISLAPEATHTYQVVLGFTLPASAPAAARGCDLVASPEQAVTNRVGLAFNGATVGSDVVCTRLPGANLSVTKTVAVGLASSADGTWTISYDVVVANAPGAGPGRYDLVDAVELPAGATGVAQVISSPAAATLTTDFDGFAQPAVATSVPIGADPATATSHTYRIQVRFRFGALDQLNPSCQAGGGIRNSASVSIEGNPAATGLACGDFAILTLASSVVNDDGGNASATDLFLATSGPTSFSGTTLVRSVVAPGSYPLAATGLSGYTTSPWTCTGGTVTSAEVEVGAGAVVRCEVVGNDNPVNMMITKSPPNDPVVAGGDPFSYTLSVWNAGTRDVDAAEPVTVVDSLPVGMEFMGPMADEHCTMSDDHRSVTCVYPASMFSMEAPVMVIPLSVRVLASAPMDLLIQPAFVSTADDPMCTGSGCTPPPCTDDASQDNMACSSVLVQRMGAIEVTKIADATGPVRPGELITYSITVTNVGDAALQAGTEVTDALPDSLVLVSVDGGPDWTCGSRDPVVCTLAAGLGAGVASTVKLTARVAPSAEGDQISNTATVRARAEVTCTGDPDCNVITGSDTALTALKPEADLTVTKTAPPGVVASGASVVWTITITNAGPGRASEVVVTDQLPATLDLVKVDAASPVVCASDAKKRLVECRIDAVDPGERAVITVTTKPIGGLNDNDGTRDGRLSISNSAQVSSQTPDPNPSNDVIAAGVLAEAPVAKLPITGDGWSGAAALVALVLFCAAVLVVERRRAS